MSDARYTNLYGKIRKALEEKPKRDALYTAMKRGRDSRAAAIAARPDGEGFRKDVRVPDSADAFQVPKPGAGLNELTT